MLLIFRFLKGYLRVLFKCNAEKVLNLTAQNGITLWDTKLLINGIGEHSGLDGYGVYAMEFIGRSLPLFHILDKLRLLLYVLF